MNMDLIKYFFVPLELYSWLDSSIFIDGKEVSSSNDNNLVKTFGPSLSKTSIVSWEDLFLGLTRVSTSGSL